MDAAANISKASLVSESDHDEAVEYSCCHIDEIFQELMQTLPKEKNWSGQDLYYYQGFWCASPLLKGVISFQQHFQAFDSDIFVATLPKCGTTWLKALTFSTLYRNQFAKDENQNPLLTSSPHKLVRFLDCDLYLNNRYPNLENYSSKPRLFATHVPYASLPASIKDSDCKIVYIARNPMDMFISFWFFYDKNGYEIEETISLDEAFGKFCNGIHDVGPFFDHVLGYWKASQENPNKVLFLQYEHLKEDIHSHIKKLAMFLGVPFTEDEEKQGVAEEIAKICSFEKLKELEVNKIGLHAFGDSQESSSRKGRTLVVQNKVFFRKGEVGDWRNYLTPSMVERMEKLIEEKLSNSGLTFKLSSKTSSHDAASASASASS